MESTRRGGFIEAALAVPWVRWLIMVSLLGAVAAGGLLWTDRLTLASEVGSYRETQGRISLSRLRRHGGSRATADVVADYTVAGHSFKVNASAGIEGGEGLEPAELVRRFPVSTSVKVYYDPDAPGRALLTRHVDTSKALDRKSTRLNSSHYS